MSMYGIRWTRLLDWAKHLQEHPPASGSIRPHKDNYREGFNDAMDMIVRWMEAEELGSETKESYVYKDPISKGTWEGK